MSIAEVIAAAKEFGIFEFYLPFMLLFAILYGLLAKSQIFGKPEEKTPRVINLIVSLFGSLALMVYTPIGVTLITFISNLFGSTFVIILSLIVFLAILYVIYGMVAPGAAPALGKWATRAVILFAIILGIGVFISSGGAAFFPGLVWAPIPGIPFIIIPGLTAQDIAIIVVVVLTGLVIYFLVRPEKK